MSQFGAACEFEAAVAGCLVPPAGDQAERARAGPAELSLPRGVAAGGLPRPRRRVPADRRGRERPLQAWDFVHCPPNTKHVFVGAGDGPCVILMVGARSEEEVLVYPVSELARRYGASVENETNSPEEAYAPYAPFPERDAARPGFLARASRV